MFCKILCTKLCTVFGLQKREGVEYSPRFPFPVGAARRTDNQSTATRTGSRWNPLGVSGGP
jgi:hypothetical protein